MKIFSTLTIALLMIFQTVGFAATGTFSASGEYTMSDYDTPEIAELHALDYAKQNATEQAGIYLESYSRSENFKLADDEIKNVASNNIKISGEPKITREILDSGVVKIRVDINATVDTTVLDEAIKKSSNERQMAVQQYKELQAMNEQIKNDLDALQKKLATLKDEVADDDLQVEQERINREFLSKQKVEELTKFIYKKEAAYDPTVIDEAIKLNPKNFQAYGMRSTRDVFRMADDLKKWISGESLLNFKLPALNLNDIHKAIILAPDEFKSDSVRLLGYYYEYTAFSNQKVGDDDAAKQNFNKALEYFNKAIETDPAKSSLYKTRANFYKEHLNDYDKALTDYNKAIELDPKDAANYKERSELHKKLGNYSEALTDLQTCKKLDEKKFDDYNSLGDIYKELKNYPKALESYTVAIEQESQFDWFDTRVIAYVNRAMLYNELGEFDKAIADCDSGIKISENAGMNGLIQYFEKFKQQITKEKMEQGESLYSDGDYSGAIEIYTKILKLVPNYEDAYFQRGRAYIADGKYLEGIADYDKLLALNPNYDKTAYYNRGWAYENIELYNEAIKDYTQVLALDPNYQHALFNRGRRYIDIGKYSESISDYDKLLALNPDYGSSAYNNRGVAYENIGDLDKALDNYNKALEMDPNNDIAKNNRQRVLDKMKK